MNLRFIFLLAAALLPVPASHSADPLPLLNETVLLGPDKTEWDHFQGLAAKKEFTTAFNLPGTPSDSAILLRQLDVKADGWTVFLNDKKAGALQLLDELGWILLPVRADLLKPGENKLRLAHPSANSPTFTDQVQVGPINFYPGASSNLFSSTLEVTVRAEGAGKIPGRITITDPNGAMVAFQNRSGSKVAARTGVAYTADGGAKLALLPGEYRIYATRGSEYSLASTTVVLSKGQSSSITLPLKHEVPTAGWVAADTHIHTFTHSRHGDATADERVITIAGEGIELPIVTEHNMHVTYAEPAQRIGVAQHFTLLHGNEVTTKRGHFNIFPVELSASPPEWRIESWTELLTNIRQTPRVQVTILNHPTDTHSGFVPFSTNNLVHGVGRALPGVDFSVDALEIVNSGAMRSDWMEPIRGWFDLLNFGHKPVAVSGSDSHDVSRYMLGQGRTYIQVPDNDPSAINIDQACAALKKGKAFVSLGLFPRITVNGRHSSGDLASAKDTLQVHVQVLGPGWIAATKVELFANGRKVAEQSASGDTLGKIEKINAQWVVKLPANDLWLVAIASGPGVHEPYWPIPRPYQPSTTNPKSPSLAITNPIWIDADGDGAFTPPRAQAENILQLNSAEQVIAALEKCDDAVLRQAVDLVNLGNSRHSSANLKKTATSERLRTAF